MAMTWKQMMHDMQLDSKGRESLIEAAIIALRKWNASQQFEKQPRWSELSHATQAKAIESILQQVRYLDMQRVHAAFLASTRFNYLHNAPATSGSAADALSHKPTNVSPPPVKKHAAAPPRNDLKIIIPLQKLRRPGS